MERVNVFMGSRGLDIHLGRHTDSMPFPFGRFSESSEFHYQRLQYRLQLLGSIHVHAMVDQMDDYCHYEAKHACQRCRKNKELVILGVCN